MSYDFDDDRNRGVHFGNVQKNSLRISVLYIYTTNNYSYFNHKTLNIFIRVTFITR